MIKVDHTIKFVENNGLDLVTPLPDNISSVMLACRQEAVTRGCMFFTFENDNKSERTITFIWDDRNAMNAFTDWTEVTHQYSTIYSEFKDLIESRGGTLERVFTEF